MCVCVCVVTADIIVTQLSLETFYTEILRTRVPLKYSFGEG